MSVTLLQKYQTASGQVPTAAQVKQREILVNTADGILYTQKSDGSIKTINPALGVPPQTLILDMGSQPVSAKLFYVNIPGAKPGMSALMSVGGNSQIGAFPDELEMDPMCAYMQVVSNNYALVSVVCSDSFGLVVGTREINFYLG